MALALVALPLWWMALASPPTLVAWEVALHTVAPDDAVAALLRGQCAGEDALAAQRCLLERTLHEDGKTLAQAMALLEHHGHLVGVTPDFVMDGGFRGNIRIAGALPVGGRRVHLGHVATALEDIHAFMAQVQARASSPVRYVWRPLPVRFFESVKRATPSAYVDQGGVAYNLRGGLNRDAATVTETLFHELFHHNDGLQRGWSGRTLGTTHFAIVARCGNRTACLRPYAPHTTRVKGGTYYAFQPGNDVGEYAAELAIRYWREQRAALAGKPLLPPFKCGPPENARAWTALKDDFFGGVDLTPGCAPPP